MGVVYLAQHPVIGRKVAIKLLHAVLARDPDIVARFFNEARAIHMIAHENIVEILDFGQTADGQPYFIMEYLTGESLNEATARGQMDVTRVEAIGGQMCRALAAAHTKGIVHRDLKPHNVQLCTKADGSLLVKILDFGVAKILAVARRLAVGQDPHRLADGDAALHVARAVQGRGRARSPHRHLLAGRDAVRDGRRPAAVQRRGCRRAVRQAHARGPASGHRIRPEHAPVHGGGDHEVAGQGSRRAVPEHGGPPQGVGRRGQARDAGLRGGHRHAPDAERHVDAGGLAPAPRRRCRPRARRSTKASTRRRARRSCSSASAAASRSRRSPPFC